MDGRIADFAEYRHYSVLLGAPAVRLSLTDARGGEFYMILAARAEKPWRVRRAEALELLEEAIRLGLDPGQVQMIHEESEQ